MESRIPFKVCAIAGTFPTTKAFWQRFEKALRDCHFLKTDSRFDREDEKSEATFVSKYDHCALQIFKNPADQKQVLMIVNHLISYPDETKDDKQSDKLIESRTEQLRTSVPTTIMMSALPAVQNKVTQFFNLGMEKFLIDERFSVASVF